MGGPVVAVRRDHRAVRQGPRDGRRLARPVATRSPARCSSASRRSTSRTSSSTSAARRCRPRRAAAPPPTRSPRSCRPSSSASCSCARGPNHAIDFDPDGTDQIPRLFDEFDKFAAATAGREVKGELPPGLRGDVPLLAARSRLPTSRPRPPPSGRRSATWRCSSRSRASTSSSGSSAEKGSALTDRERAILDERAAAARAWLDAYAPESARLVPIQRDAVPPRRRRARRRRSGDSSPGWPSARRARRRRAATPGRRSIFARRHGRGRAAGRRAFEAIYRAFLGRPNGPRAGWLLASLDPGVRRRPRRPRPAAARRRSAPHERRPAATARRAGRHPPGRDRQGRGPGARRPRARAGRPPAPAARRERGAQGGAERRLEADRRGDQGRRVARTAPRSRS